MLVRLLTIFTFLFPALVFAVSTPTMQSGSSTIKVGSSTWIHWSRVDPINYYIAKRNLNGGSEWSSVGVYYNLTNGAKVSFTSPGSHCFKVIATHNGSWSGFSNQRCIYAGYSGVIKSQKSVTINSGRSYTFNASSVSITDADSSNHTIHSIGAGAGYTVSGNKITTSHAFSGVISIPVRYKDSHGFITNQFTFKIHVIGPVTTPEINIDPLYQVENYNLYTWIRWSRTNPINYYLLDENFNNEGWKRKATLYNLTNAYQNTYERNSDGEYSEGNYCYRVIATYGGRWSGWSTPHCIHVSNPGVISNQNEITFAANTAYTVSESDVIIEKNDRPHEIFEITVGENYTVNGNTILPNNDYIGLLHIPVQFIDDKGIKTNTYTIKIRVSSKIINQSVTYSSVPGDFTLHWDSAGTIEKYRIDQFARVDDKWQWQAERYTTQKSIKYENYVGVYNFSIYRCTIDTICQSEAENVAAHIVNEVQKTIALAKNSSYTFTDSDFMFEGKDKTYDIEYIAVGENYTVTDATITPSSDFTGQLNVPIKLKIRNNEFITTNTFTSKVIVLGDVINPRVIHNEVPGSFTLNWNQNGTIEKYRIDQFERIGGKWQWQAERYTRDTSITYDNYSGVYNFSIYRCTKHTVCLAGAPNVEVYVGVMQDDSGNLYITLQNQFFRISQETGKWLISEINQEQWHTLSLSVSDYSLELGSDSAGGFSLIHSESGANIGFIYTNSGYQALISPEGDVYVQVPDDLGGQYLKITKADGEWLVEELTQSQWDSEAQPNPDTGFNSQYLKLYQVEETWHIEEITQLEWDELTL